MQAGDILLVPGHGPLERAIEWATVSNWSHAALFVGDGMLVEAKEFHGVRRVPATTYDGVYFRVAASQMIRDLAVHWAETRVGQSYGWRDVAQDAGMDLFHLAPRRMLSRRVDCSVLVWWSYRQAGLNLTNRPVPAPADLGWSPLLNRL